MKKQYLLYIIIMLTSYACSTSKSTHTGGNHSTNTPTDAVVVPEKKVEKAVLTETGTKKSLPTQTNEQRMMSQNKNNVPATRTFEAIPSVPDTL